MSPKSNKIELSEEFMVIWKEELPREVFCKKGVRWNFAKFTEKHLCQSLFLNKVARLAKFLRTHFLQNASGRLLPKFNNLPDKFQIFSDWYFRIKFCFKCEIFFQLNPKILIVIKLAWHWLVDTQRPYSLLYNVTTSCRRIDILWHCNDVVCPLCRMYFLIVVPSFQKRSAR